MGKAGVTQLKEEEDKAAELGISRMTLWRYRTGRRPCPTGLKRKIEKIDKRYARKARKDTNGR
jgi:transcriptional regulator with XRE-family HTH domain